MQSSLGQLSRSGTFLFFPRMVAPLALESPSVDRYWNKKQGVPGAQSSIAVAGVVWSICLGQQRGDIDRHWSWKHDCSTLAQWRGRNLKKHPFHLPTRMSGIASMEKKYPRVRIWGWIVAGSSKTGWSVSRSILSAEQCCGMVNTFQRKGYSEC